MLQTELTPIKHNERSTLFFIFSIWSFIILCRPQDYVSFLAYLRPVLTIGIVTLIMYFISVTNSINISGNKQFRLFLYFITALILSVPFSYYRSASLKDAINYVSINVMFFFLFIHLVNNVTKLRTLLFLYCSGLAIYALFILKSGSFAEDRIFFGSMFDPNDSAFFIINFLTFNLLFMRKGNKYFQRIISVLNMVICLIVIWKTGSRGGLVAVISIAAYLMFAKTITIRLSFITKVILVIAAIASLQLVNMSSKRYETLFDLKNDYNITGEEGRLAIWGIGVRMILARPITGVGMNRYSEGVARDREARGMTSGVKWQTAHNSLVQIGAETGVFGLFIYCLMTLNVFRITSEIINKSKSQELIKICEMSRAGFIGHFISAMFLSQAYSIYWVFYIVLSAVLKSIFDKEMRA